MTQEEFVTAVETVGLPVRYDHGEDGLKLPFIYYTFVRGALLHADNKTYAKQNNVSLNLVTTSKAQQNEYSEKIEDLLDSLDIPYGTPDEGWSDGEKFYLLTYDLEV